MSIFTQPSAVTAYFEPQPDITAFELATIISEWAGGEFRLCKGKEHYCNQEDWERYPEALKRHWRLA